MMALESERAQPVVRPDGSVVLARGAMRLLEVAPDDLISAQLDGTYERPATRFTTLASENLRLAPVIIDPPAWCTQKVLRRRQHISIGPQTGVPAGDLLGAGLAMLNLPHQRTEIHAVDENLDLAGVRRVVTRHDPERSLVHATPSARPRVSCAQDVS